MGEKLTLTIPNPVALQLMEKNGFMGDLRRKVRTELGLDLEISCAQEELDGEAFLEEKENEERLISKDVLLKSQKEVGGQKKPSASKSSASKLDNYSFGREIKSEIIKVENIDLQTGVAAIKGEIFELETREIKGNRLLISFYITDKTDSILVKTFLSKEQADEFLGNIGVGDHVILEGDVIYDNFSRCIAIMLKSLVKIQKIERMDNAQEKRIEFHLHTKMSAMDGVADAKKVIERAHKWGHEAIAIADTAWYRPSQKAMEVGKAGY